MSKNEQIGQLDQDDQNEQEKVKMS